MVWVQLEVLSVCLSDSNLEIFRGIVIFFSLKMGNRSNIVETLCCVIMSISRNNPY